ncbi:hypothetical protein ACFQDG_07240, partial [Natronoarchaeum mannanilyticum]
MTTDTDRTESRGTRRARIALLVGFVALTTAVIAAHRSPARSYELSIYEATPLLFWGGVGVAAL